MARRQPLCRCDAERLPRRVPEPHRRRARKGGRHRRGRRTRRVHRAAGGGRLRRGRGPPLGRTGRRGRRPRRDAAPAELLPRRPPRGPRALPGGRQGRRSGGRVQQPARHEGRPRPRAACRAVRGGPDRRGQGVLRRHPPLLPDLRTRPGPGRPGRHRRPGPGDGDRRVTGLDLRLPERPAARLRRVVGGGHQGRPRHRTPAVPHPAPAAALGLTDRVRAGHQAQHGPRLLYTGPCRQPRVPLTPEHEAFVRTATEKAIAEGLA